MELQIMWGGGEDCVDIIGKEATYSDNTTSELLRGIANDGE